jgi:hypothetical protein
MFMSDEMGRVYSTNGDMRNAYIILVGEPEEMRRPLGGARHRWVDNIVTYQGLA